MPQNYTLNANMSMTATSATGYSQSQSGSYTLNITGVDQIETGRKDVTSGSDETIMAAPGHGRFVYVKNLDDTNFAILRITGDTSTDFAVRLDPSSSYIITSTSSTGLDDYADISGVTLEDLLAVSATADTAAVDLELFVASI